MCITAQSAPVGVEGSEGSEGFEGFEGFEGSVGSVGVEGVGSMMGSSPSLQAARASSETKSHIR